MQEQEKIRLIVNADDFGYSPCISKGILTAVKQGTVTATGILANAVNLEEQLTWLDGEANLSVGVHLNLSWGKPLSARLSEKLSAFAEGFPSVHQMNFLLMTGRISLKEVRHEWEAQIEVCQRHNRALIFLNSHEHIHMLPGLFSLTTKLARAFNIPNVRLSQAEWVSSLTLSAVVRNILIQGMSALDYRYLDRPAPVLLGLGQSGKLDFAYLEKILSKLKAGKTYELMCHPGYYDSNEILDDRLKAYHDWEGELSLLQNSTLLALYEKLNIQLSHY